MALTSKIKQWTYTILQILIVITLAINVLSDPSPKNLAELQTNALKVFPTETNSLDITDPSLQSATLLKVIDGDTIKVILNKKEETIRLIGIDTPETHRPNTPVQCYGPEATQALKDKLTSTTLYLETDPSQDLRDRYDRLLAYIFTTPANSNTQNNIPSTPQNINLWLIQEGYAREYTYNKPYKYQSEFQKIELEAQAEQKGLWEACQK